MDKICIHILLISTEEFGDPWSRGCKRDHFILHQQSPNHRPLHMGKAIPVVCGTDCSIVLPLPLVLLRVASTQKSSEQPAGARDHICGCPESFWVHVSLAVGWNDPHGSQWGRHSPYTRSGLRATVWRPLLYTVPTQKYNEGEERITYFETEKPNPIWAMINSAGTK